MTAEMANLLVWLVFVALSAAGMALWIWMLIDCATNEPPTGNDKVVWILIIAIGQIIGALIYYFARRPRRMATYGR
ncbi:MAG: PLDc N-terminal domain-containing protein [Candidatus Hydrogenedentales bacterium]|jgi:hypothetical protein